MVSSSRPLTSYFGSCRPDCNHATSELSASMRSESQETLSDEASGAEVEADQSIAGSRGTE